MSDAPHKPRKPIDPGLVVFSLPDPPAPEAGPAGALGVLEGLITEDAGSLRVEVLGQDVDAIAEAAAQRLGAKGPATVVVTESASFARGCRKAGFETLSVGSAFSPSSWASVPLRIAHRFLAPDADVSPALDLLLASHGLQLATWRRMDDGVYAVSAHGFVPLEGKDLAWLAGVEVPVPRTVRVRAEDPFAMEIAPLDPATVDEIRDHVRGLAERGGVAGGPVRGVGPSAPTHVVETDKDGRRRLVRRRYSGS